MRWNFYWTYCLALVAIPSSRFRLTAIKLLRWGRPFRSLAAVRLWLCFPADRTFLLSNAEIHFLCSPETNSVQGGKWFPLCFPSIYGISDTSYPVSQTEGAGGSCPACPADWALLAIRRSAASSHQPLAMGHNADTGGCNSAIPAAVADAVVWIIGWCAKPMPIPASS